MQPECGMKSHSSGSNSITAKVSEKMEEYPELYLFKKPKWSVSSPEVPNYEEEDGG